VKPVRLRQIAKRDLRDAVAWYAERNRDVGQRFADEVSRTLELIERFSATGGPVPGVSDREVRRLPVHNFPYHVVFVELRDRIAVLAVAHDRRRPAYWARG
jgi:toxin ParE1/3/4